MELSLAEVPDGSEVVIVNVLGGGFRMRRRLLEMGLVPGSRVEILRSREPVVIRVRGVTLALERELARRILVKMVGDVN